MAKKLTVLSSGFADGEMMPVVYTCDNPSAPLGINPSISISGIPDSAKSLAIMALDPDSPSGTWTHWLKWNMPVNGGAFTIGEGVEPEGVSGLSTGGEASYEGPCPGSGTHHYVFTVYALDAFLDLKIGSNKENLLKAIRGHVVAQGSIVGLYNRNK